MEDKILSREERLEVDLRRYSNPWTVQVWNHKDERWNEFCHDAPITLSDAEQRIEDYGKGDSTAKARFRAIPWLNGSQLQHVRMQYESSTDDVRAALAEAQQEVDRLKRVNQAICKHAKYWIDVFESSPHDEGCGVPSQIPPVEEYTDEMLAARPCTCRKARVIKNAAFVLELPLVPSLESPEGSILPQVRHEQVLEIQRLTADLAKERETSRDAMGKIRKWADELRRYMPSHGTYAEEMINLCDAIQHVSKAESARLIAKGGE